MTSEAHLKTLGKIVTLQTEKVIENKDRHMPYIGLEHIASDGFRLIGAAMSETSISVNSVFQKDDILFGKLRPNLRKSVRAPFSGYCSTDILVLRSISGIDPGFVSRIFQWDRVFDAAVATAAGTKMPRTSWSDLKEFQVLIPESIKEQERIACVLDNVDDEISRTDALIDKLKQIRTGLLHDLLTCGLDENGKLRDPIGHPENFKDSPIGPISNSWDALPLDKVASVDRGKFGHRPRNDPALYGGIFPFIQTGDIASAAGEIIVEASQSLNPQGAAVSRQFPAGTIAITIAANIGDTAILGRPMFFPDSIVGVVPLSSHSSRWIEMCLRRAKTRLNALAPQSAQKNINLSFLKPLIIPVPHPSEQQRCSELYESLSSQILIQSNELEKLNAIKSGLMSDLLTGRVRVPQDLELE